MRKNPSQLTEKGRPNSRSREKGGSRRRNAPRARGRRVQGPNPCKIIENRGVASENLANERNTAQQYWVTRETAQKRGHGGRKMEVGRQKRQSGKRRSALRKGSGKIGESRPFREGAKNAHYSLRGNPRKQFARVSPFQRPKNSGGRQSPPPPEPPQPP